MDQVTSKFRKYLEAIQTMKDEYKIADPDLMLPKSHKREYQELKKQYTNDLLTGKFTGTFDLWIMKQREKKRK